MDMGSASKAAGIISNVAVLLTDSKYMPAALFVAHKLSLQKPRNFDIRVLATDCPEYIRSSIDDGIVVQDFVPDVSALKAASKKRKPPIAFGRLTMDASLPEQYQKILYLDCDLWIGSRSISDLFEMDLDGYAFAAVHDAGDIFRSSTPGWQHYKQLLGMQRDTPYFNSGVMLIDRKKFRDEQIGERSLAYMANGGYLGTLNDQSALNAIVKGEWLPISPIWNWMFASYTHLTNEFDPAIIHFIGDHKPWNDHRARFNPVYRQDMRHYLESLGFSDFVNEVPSLHKVRRVIKQAVYSSASRFKISRRERQIRSVLAEPKLGAAVSIRAATF
jgi:lipopolysaccharide biosynthesis glycosyltransferase